MNKEIILILIVLIFNCNISQAKEKDKKLNEFAVDLASANIKLRGTLRLSPEFNGDLSTLSYNYYLVALKNSETKSNKGISKIIRKSEGHVFGVKNNSFLIAVYSKKLSAVLFDDANTMRLDSIIVINKKEPIPGLTEMVKNTGFQMVDYK